MKLEYLLFNLIIAVPILLLSTFRPFNLRAIKIRPAFISIIISALVFIVFDMYATGVFWSFNPQYIIGVKLYQIPLEEILFFFSVPFSCLFVWENLPRYKGLVHKNYSVIFALIISIAGIYSLNKSLWYTASVCCMILVMIIADLLLRTQLFQKKRFYLFLFIINILTLIFNFYLTYRPVVLYDGLYKTNFNILTIPIEDFMFGTALLTMNALLYEKMQ